MKKHIGNIFLGLSFVMLLVPLIIGFFGLSTKMVAFIVTWGYSNG
jgi:hypothetical protein